VRARISLSLQERAIRAFFLQDWAAYYHKHNEASGTTSAGSACLEDAENVEQEKKEAKEEEEEQQENDADSTMRIEEVTNACDVFYVYHHTLQTHAGWAPESGRACELGRERESEKMRDEKQKSRERVSD